MYGAKPKIHGKILNRNKPRLITLDLSLVETPLNPPETYMKDPRNFLDSPLKHSKQPKTTLKHLVTSLQQSLKNRTTLNLFEGFSNNFLS